MKHNIIPKALRWMAAAGLCLAAAACSKDDITPEPAPQQGITPTKIIFNVTRGGYEGDAETRAPKSEWAEGDVVYFGRGYDINNLATYTDGEWVVSMQSPISENSTTVIAVYGEHIRQDATNYGTFYVDAMGDVAYTTVGSYKVDEGGVATITLRLGRHPQGRMTFTGVGKGKELTVLNMKSLKFFQPSSLYEVFGDSAPVTLTGEDDGTATLYALPAPSIVTEDGITLTAQYEGKLYTKTFAGKEFKKNSNITLAAPSLESGWEEAATEYTAADLKMGDYLYSDGTTSDGGLRKLYPDGTVETATEAVAPEAGKTVIGIVFHAGRHATDASDYTSPLTAGGPTLAGEVRGYAVAITDVNDFSDSPCWAIGPNKEYTFEIGVSINLDDWNGYANCRAIHDYVTAHAGEGWEMRHFQAAWACETYGNRSLDYDGNPTSAYEWQAPLKAPAGTSGWFLPSCGQLWYMIPYKDYLNGRFMAAKAASATELQGYVKEFNNSRSYWSSTGDQNPRFISQASCVDFMNNYRTGITRNNNLFSRPVIVF